jgi:hypothetical protein
MSVKSRQDEEKTDRSPQSSHSRTGFHPSLFVQMSHLATNRPLEKNKSSGFQPAVTSPFPLLPGGEAVPLNPLFLGFVPGFRSENR